MGSTVVSSTGATNAENDKKTVISKLIREVDSSQRVSGTVTLNDKSRVQTDGTYYYYGENDLTIPASTINLSTIQMVHSKKNVIIDGNITYGGNYGSLSETPKLVIYGKNVLINCHVTDIDALIIADEKVVTCNNFENDMTNMDTKIEKHINDQINSNPLRINGAVISKVLVANRTYGNATGANSIVPSEIINFDPTLYMWGGLGNDEGSDGDLTINSIKELAPRV
jgi:hypothetical protein